MKVRREAETAAVAVLVAFLQIGNGDAWAQAGSSGPPAEGAGGSPPRRGRVALSYRLGKGAAGCDDEATFRKWVASRMEGTDPFAPAGTKVREGPSNGKSAAPRDGTATHVLDVLVERAPPGVRAVAELRDAEGALILRRELLERECADVIDRLVLLTALSVFPPPAPAATVPPPAAPSSHEFGLCPKCPDTPVTEREAWRADSDEARARLRVLETAVNALRGREPLRFSVALSTGALVTANLTSDAGAGLWLGAEARTGPLSMAIEARAVLPSRVDSGPRDFEASFVGGALVPCGRHGPFFGCLSAGAGAEIQQVSAPPPELSETTCLPVVSVGGRAGADIPLGQSRFGARLWGEVLYTTPRPSPDATDPLATAVPGRSALSALFGVGLVIRLDEEEKR